MKSLNLYTASQVALSIALCVMLLIGFYAVAMHVLDVASYKVMLLSSAIITIVQFTIELIKEQKTINI